MSGYYSRPYRKNYQNPRYKPKYYPREIPVENPIEPSSKSEAIQANFPKTRDEGIQIDMGEGIPCRLIPINPDDYPKLLALLNLHQNP